MPLSRWSSELLDLLEWVNREDLSLEDIFLGSVVSKLSDLEDEKGEELKQEDLIGGGKSLIIDITLRILSILINIS